MDYKFSERVKNLTGNAIREIFKVLQDPEMITFAGGLPASDCLPKAEVAKMTEKLMSGDNAVSILQYGATDGYMPLKQTITKYVERFNIFNTTVENNMIISGGQQAIDLSLKCLTNEGDTVLVQKPTYLAFLHIAKTYRVNCEGVELDEGGIDIEDLERKIIKFKPKLLYLVPTFHNPTGLCITTDRKKKIAELANKYDLPVLEDEPYYDLRYSGENTPSIKSFDKNGNVIYSTSFSKTVAPGLRTAALVADAKLINKLQIAKQAVDVHTCTLSQAIINELIISGFIFENMKKAVPIYKMKLDRMLQKLDEYMPKSFEHTSPEGGLFVWGKFNDGTVVNDYFKKSLENKVAFVCGSEFFADGSGTNCMRLNFSNATMEKIDLGVKRLAQTFSKN